MRIWTVTGAILAAWVLVGCSTSPEGVANDADRPPRSVTSTTTSIDVTANTDSLPHSVPELEDGEAASRGCSYFRPDRIDESRLDQDDWRQGHPMMAAAASGDPKTVKALLDSGTHGMEVDQRDGLSSVEVAARSGCVEIMEHLVAGDALLSPSGVYAPLVGAVRSGNPQMVAYLLEAGVDPNQVATGHPESDGSTALGTAAYLGQVEMIDLLVAAGAQVDARNSTGDAPLGLAVTSEEWAAATRLLAAGAEPTPDMLVAAVANRSLEGVKLLVSAGVDPSVPASDGQTAIDAARSNRYADILSYLAETEEAP